MRHTVSEGKKRIGKKKRRWLLALGAILLFPLTIWTIWGNKALQLNKITVTSLRLPQGFDGYRIAHVSDLHNTEFGTDNEDLLALLREAEPDMIAITGDLVDSRRTDVSVALRFAEQAMKIAPCYYVTGNHESRISQYHTLKAGLTDLGVEVLENESLTLERLGEQIRLLGVNDPAFRTRYLSDDASQVMDGALQTLSDPEGSFTVLLSHRPELFGVYAAHSVDLVLSGHAHGGQFRLPFVGGLVAPNQGLFPKYDSGLYTEGSTHMVVSRGLGNSIVPIRFCNRPEVLLIELKCG